MSEFMDQLSRELSQYGLSIKKIDVVLGELEHELARLASAAQVIADIELGVSVVPRDAVDIVIVIGAQNAHIFYNHNGPEEVVSMLRESGEVLLSDQRFLSAISKSVEPTGESSYTIIYLDGFGKTHVLSTPVRGHAALILSAVPAIQTVFSAMHENVDGYRDGEQIATIVRLNVLSSGSLGSVDVLPPIHTPDAAKAASEFIDSDEMEGDLLEMAREGGPYIGIIVLHDEKRRSVFATTLGLSVRRFRDSVLFEPIDGGSRIREYRETEAN
jgi:hypothetical protein